MIRSFSRLMLVRIIIIGIIVGGAAIFAFFGVGDSGSLAVAKNLKKETASLSGYTTGDLDLASMYEYYGYTGLTIEDLGLAPEQQEQFDALIKVGNTIRNNVPNVADSSSSGVNGSYLGEEKSDGVYGMYILEFKDGIKIDQAVLELANSVGIEYYLQSGNYLAIVDAAFVESNGVDMDTLLNNFVKATK